MSTAAASRAKELTLNGLQELFAPAAAQCVAVRLWDGTPWPDAVPRPATLVLNHPGALRAMLQPGTELGLAEAYLYRCDGLSSSASRWAAV
jgi:hypothetical protein